MRSSLALSFPRCLRHASTRARAREPAELNHHHHHCVAPRACGSCGRGETTRRIARRCGPRRSARARSAFWATRCAAAPCAQHVQPPAIASAGAAAWIPSPAPERSPHFDRRVARARAVRLQGAAAIRLRFYHSTFAVVCAHLNANKLSAETRNAEYRQIRERLAFTVPREVAKAQAVSAQAVDEAPRGAPLVSLKLRHHDVTIWMGDLNYRLSHGAAFKEAQVRELIKEGKYEPLLSCCQLHEARRGGRAFEGYQEAPIAFAPTYKYDLSARAPGARATAAPRRRLCGPEPGVARSHTQRRRARPTRCAAQTRRRTTRPTRSARPHGQTACCGRSRRARASCSACPRWSTRAGRSTCRTIGRCAPFPQGRRRRRATCAGRPCARHAVRCTHARPAYGTQYVPRAAARPSQPDLSARDRACAIAPRPCSACTPSHAMRTGLLLDARGHRG